MSVVFVYGIGTVVAVVGALIIAARARRRFAERDQQYLHARWNRMARANDFAAELFARGRTDRVVVAPFGYARLFRNELLCTVPPTLWRQHP